MKKLTATSPEAQSADLMAENIEKLEALFPELLSEGPNGVAVNVDVLKALVGDATVTDADEKYGLNWHGNTGFRVFKLDSSNIRAWNPNSADLEHTLFNYQEHILPGRSEADVLYELLLKLGLALCVPIEQRTIAGCKVHSVGGGVLVACLAEQITREQVEPLAQGIIDWHKELAPAGDTTCVFRDSAFADDVAKTNLAAILEQHGIQNVRSL